MGKEALSICQNSSTLALKKAETVNEKIACVGSPSEDPSTGGLSSLEQTLAKHLLELGLQLKVCLAALHRYQELWKL